MHIDEIQQAIDSLPRERLLHLPTPLQPLDHLRQLIGGPRVWIKRDDLTGLAFGGNKSRYLEFTLAAARASGADAVVLSAVVHSNHCRQFAAAAARLGLEAVVVLRQDDTAMGRTDPATGNYLLDQLFGARIRVCAANDVAATVAEEMDRLRAAGRRPFTGLSALLSRVAYIQCALELAVQCDAAGIQPATVVIGSGSNSLAGLLAGFTLLGREIPLLGTPQGHLRDPEQAPQRLVDAAAEAIRHLGLAVAMPPASLVRVDDGFVGPGFGHLDAPTLAAIRQLARSEGLLVDPAYTGKAFSALLSGIREGLWSTDQDLLFVHTGGTPLLFTYSDELLVQQGNQ